MRTDFTFRWFSSRYVWQDGLGTLRDKEAVRRGRLGNTSWLMPTMIPATQRVLNQYGAQGWEYAGTPGNYYVFKRPK
jgi:hypothetical protein